MTRKAILEALGLEPKSKHAWTKLRDQLRLCPYVEIGESNNESHLFAVRFYAIWEETNRLLTAEAIAAKVEELENHPPRWLPLLPSRRRRRYRPTQQPEPAPPHHHQTNRKGGAHRPHRGSALRERAGSAPGSARPKSVGNRGRAAAPAMDPDTWEFK